LIVEGGFAVGRDVMAFAVAAVAAADPPGHARKPVAALTGHPVLRRHAPIAAVVDIAGALLPADFGCRQPGGKTSEHGKPRFDDAIASVVEQAEVAVSLDQPALRA